METQPILNVFNGSSSPRFSIWGMTHEVSVHALCICFNSFVSIHRSHKKKKLQGTYFEQLCPCWTNLQERILQRKFSSKSLHLFVFLYGGGGGYSCFTCRSRWTVNDASSGERSFVPVTTISEDSYSLFSCLWQMWLKKILPSSSTSILWEAKKLKPQRTYTPFRTTQPWQHDLSAAPRWLIDHHYHVTPLSLLK